MFVWLSKTLDLLLEPLTWALLLVLAALAFRRRARLASGLQLGAVAVLLVFASPFVAGALTRAAESSAATTFRPGVVYDAVVVLGGCLDPAAAEASGKPEFNEAAERFVEGYDVLRSGRASHILISGGTFDPRPGALTEARALAAQLRAWGVAPERIVVDERSRNTRENAVETARIVRERGWRRLLLVTSAAHMRRALGCFRAEGLDPDTLPVDYRGAPSAVHSMWLPRAEALDQATDAVRELAGRVVYRVMGYAK